MKNTQSTSTESVPASGLYNPRAGKSNCGVGVVVNLDGTKTHQLIEDGFRILENIDHRGARGAEGGQQGEEDPHARAGGDAVVRPPATRQSAVRAAETRRPRELDGASPPLPSTYRAAGAHEQAWRLTLPSALPAEEGPSESARGARPRFSG